MKKLVWAYTTRGWLGSSEGGQVDGALRCPSLKSWVPNRLECEILGSSVSKPQFPLWEQGPQS